MSRPIPGLTPEQIARRKLAADRLRAWLVRQREQRRRRRKGNELEAALARLDQLMQQPRRRKP